MDTLQETVGYFFCARSERGEEWCVVNLYSHAEGIHRCALNDGSIGSQAKSFIKAS
jgi:hypothetical protein